MRFSPAALGEDELGHAAGISKTGYRKIDLFS
jgi:hypothetical protein